MAIAAVNVTVDKYETGGDGYSTKPNEITMPNYSAATLAEFEQPKFAVTASQDGVTHTATCLTTINPEEVNPPWPGFENFKQHSNSYVKFASSGRSTMTVRMLDDQANGIPITGVTVIKHDKAVPVVFSGDTCVFNVEEHGVYEVLVNDPTTANYTGPLGPLDAQEEITDVTVTKDTHKNPLFIIVVPPEISTPNPADYDYVYGEGSFDLTGLPVTAGRKFYFGDGLIDIGLELVDDGNGNVAEYAGGLQLTDLDDVYMSLSCVLRGCMWTHEANPSNINIHGHGIITHRGQTATAAELSQWGNHGISILSDSHGNNGVNNRVNGITIIETIKGALTAYNQLHISHCHIFSWIKRADGFTAGDGSVISKNYFKTQDDPVKVFYSDMYVAHNVIWQQNSGGPCKFSWKGQSSTSGSYVFDNVLSHSDAITDYKSVEVDKPHLNSTSAVFAGMGVYSGAYIGPHIVHKFKVLEPNLLRLAAFRCVSVNSNTSGQATYFGQREGARGYQDIFFADVELVEEPYLPMTYYGNDGGSITRMHWQDLKVANSVIPNRASFSSKLHPVGSYLEVSANQSVSNVWNTSQIVTGGWSQNGDVYTSAGDSTALGYNVNNDTNLAGGWYRSQIVVTGAGTVRVRTRNATDTGNDEIAILGSGTHNIGPFEVPVRGFAIDDRGNVGMGVEVIELVQVNVTETEQWSNPPPDVGAAWTHDGSGTYTKEVGNTTWQSFGFPEGDSTLVDGAYLMSLTVVGTIRAFSTHPTSGAITQLGEFVNETVTDLEVEIRNGTFYLSHNSEGITVSNISLKSRTSSDVVSGSGPMGTVTNVQVFPRTLGVA